MSLVILFLAVWAIGSIFLVVIDVIHPTDRLWVLVGGALLIFLVWSVLLWWARRHHDG
jgi:hypothetical protein